MNDAALRRHKELVLTPLARRVPAGLHPSAVTLAALVPGIGAAMAAAWDRPILAMALWLVNRLLDGLDGTLARVHGTTSDLGAYLDILADFVVYAAVPVGVAAGIGGEAVWVAAAALLATFYVNTISWAYLSAILERRRAADAVGGRWTAVAMPGGLIEGAETVILFAVMLALPAWSPELMWAMAAAVAVTVGQRLVWAVRFL